MALVSDEHICQFAKLSYSNLRTLPPYSTWRERLWRNFQKKILLPSMTHPLSSLFFRSSATLACERKRYILNGKWFIIHPISNMMIIRDILQFTIWTMVWIFLPYYKTFIRYDKGRNVVIYSTFVIASIIYYLNSLLFFITGQCNIETKEITVTFKQIASNYFRTYLAVDMFAAFPFNAIFSLDDSFLVNEMLMVFQVICKLFRMPEYFKSFRQITYPLGISEMLHDVLCLPLINFLLAHWTCCAIYLGYIRSVEGNTWFMPSIGGKVINHTVRYGIDAYRIVMEKTVCIFLRAGTGVVADRGSKECLEQMLLAVIMVIAFILHVYTIIVVLQTSRSTNASEYKYEEIVCQLKQYMQSKDLPYDLRYRILHYYEHRYQNHYFREDTIRDAISEHLYHEIFLNSCSRLIETTNVLQGLSKYIIGEIIICLTPDVFLTNDYVTIANEPADYLYFISYGTAAMYLPSGEEILHFEDGDLIGLMLVDNEYEMDVIAIETTEVFRWNKKDYLQCLKRHESFAKRIKIAQQQRESYIKDYQYKKESDRYTGNVLYQLARGSIVDKLTRRAAIFD